MKAPRPLLWTVSALRWLGLAALTFSAIAAEQPATGPNPNQRSFSVGFLPEGSDFINATILMELVRRDLLARPSVVSALLESGFAAEVELSPCDGPRDMVQRMNQDEFDLVFATSVVYARQQGDYGEPILMTYRPGDFKLPRDSGVLRQGLLIAGRASPLFRQPNPDKDAQRAALAASALAVPSSDSAPGYIYPTLKLHQDYTLTGPGKYWFCGSDGEVVKNVVAGMAPLGACRKGELEALLPGVPEGRYYRILFQTDQFPTDPIVPRRELAPDRSSLGREIKVALKDFFKRSPDVPRDLSVENAGAPSFDKLRRDLLLFDEINRRPDPRAPATGGSRPTTATLTSNETDRPVARPALPAELWQPQPALPRDLGGRP